MQGEFGILTVLDTAFPVLFLKKWDITVPWKLSWCKEMKKYY